MVGLWILEPPVWHLAQCECEVSRKIHRPEAYLIRAFLAARRPAQVFAFGAGQHLGSASHHAPCSALQCATAKTNAAPHSRGPWRRNYMSWAGYESVVEHRANGARAATALQPVIASPREDPEPALCALCRGRGAHLAGSASDMPPAMRSAEPGHEPDKLSASSIRRQMGGGKVRAMGRGGAVAVRVCRIKREGAAFHLNWSMQPAASAFLPHSLARVGCDARCEEP